MHCVPHELKFVSSSKGKSTRDTRCVLQVSAKHRKGRREQRHAFAVVHHAIHLLKDKTWRAQLTRDSVARATVWAVVSFWKEKREAPSSRGDWEMLRSRAYASWDEMGG